MIIPIFSVCSVAFLEGTPFLFTDSVFYLKDNR